MQKLGELVVATGSSTPPIERVAGAVLTAVESKDASMRRLARAAPRSFSAIRTKGLAELKVTLAALRKVTTLSHHLDAMRARTDRRGWVIKRRERTRQLIELSGLSVKAGLIELANDDRAVLLGAFDDIAAGLRTEERDQLIVL